MGQSLKKNIVILTALAFGLTSCGHAKRPSTGLWLQARRLLLSQTYGKLKVDETPSKTPAKTISEQGPTEEKTEVTEKSQGKGSENLPQGPEKEGNAPVTLFGQGTGIATPGALPPSIVLGGAPRNLLGGSNAPGNQAAFNTQNIPPRYPNPNLIGSPKISSMPGGGSISGTPTGAGATTGSNSSPTISPNTTTSSNTPTPPSGETHQQTAPSAPTPSLQTSNLTTDTNLQVALQDTKQTTPGQTSLEGTLGSTAESAVLPSFDAVYITLPDQDIEYYPTRARILDINVWFLPSPAIAYGQVATFRYYTQRYYKICQPGDTNCSVPDLNPECTREELTDKGLIKDTCKGPFPFANGGFLRVIDCGKPNTQVLDAFGGSITNFMQKAWVEGDSSVWYQELCNERLYYDYVFTGADASILFPLEDGKLYFITQFPVDYLDHTTDYGDLVPFNFQTPPPPGQYVDSWHMNHYLHAGKIVRLITGGLMAGTGTDTAPLSLTVPWLGDKSPVPREGDATYANVALLDPSALANITATITEEIPNSEICLPYKNWNPDFITKETELFQKINEARQAGATCGNIGTFAPTNPLSTNASLRCAARYHDKDMSDQDYFSHLGLDGSSELTRIFVIGTRPEIGATTLSHTPSGSLFAMAAENIAMGDGDPAVAVREWLASEGHCANMMNPSFTNMGPAYYIDPANPKGPYWTVTFGTPWQ